MIGVIEVSIKTVVWVEVNVEGVGKGVTVKLVEDSVQVASAAALVVADPSSVQGSVVAEVDKDVIAGSTVLVLDSSSVQGGSVA